MNGTLEFDELSSGEVSSEQALALFDELEPVNLEFMLGRWPGHGFPTGHRMDGLLEHFHWYGKVFENTETVHPLVFQHRNEKQLCLNPIWFPLRMAARSPVSMSAITSRVFDWAMPLLQTRRSRARLRMTEYRGKVSATMVYDHKPINDVFRKIDDNRVLGLMDQKGGGGARVQRGPS